MIKIEEREDEGTFDFQEHDGVKWIKFLIGMPIAKAKDKRIEFLTNFFSRKTNDC